MEIKITNFNNLKPKHQNLIRETAKGLGLVLNSPSFQFDILNASMGQTNGTNPAGVRQRFIEGSNKEGTIYLDVMSFHSFSNTIAYSLFGSLKYHYNEKFLDEYCSLPAIEGQASMAKTIIHEFMHDPLGFKHKWPYSKPKSVPYVYGGITYKNYVGYYTDGIMSKNVNAKSSFMGIESHQIGLTFNLD